MKVPDNVGEIGSYALYGCHGLEKLEIGRGVKKTGICAISHCLGLKSLVLPDLNEGGTKSNRTYRVEGKRTTTNEWNSAEADSQFFRVWVGTPE